MQQPSRWILIISALLALMELGVSLLLLISPESMADTIDLQAQGVDYLMYVWASRQFALGGILAYATFKKSIPMLRITYLFLVLMFLGDALIGWKLGNAGMMGMGVVLGGLVGWVLWRLK